MSVPSLLLLTPPHPTPTGLLHLTYPIPASILTAPTLYLNQSLGYPCPLILFLPCCCPFCTVVLELILSTSLPGNSLSQDHLRVPHQASRSSSYLSHTKGSLTWVPNLSCKLGQRGKRGTYLHYNIRVQQPCQATHYTRG